MVVCQIAVHSNDALSLSLQQPNILRTYLKQVLSVTTLSQPRIGGGLTLSSCSFG